MVKREKGGRGRERETRTDGCDGLRSGLSSPGGERDARVSKGQGGLEGKGGAHVLDALGIAGVNVAQDVGDETVGGGLVGKVEGGGVDEGEGETTGGEGVVVVGDVDVE